MPTGALSPQLAQLGHVSPHGQEGAPPQAAQARGNFPHRPELSEEVQKLALSQGHTEEQVKRVLSLPLADRQRFFAMLN